MDSMTERDRVTILRVVPTWIDDERLSLVQYCGPLIQQ